MKSISVLLTDGTNLMINAESFRVDGDGYLHVGTVAIFAPAQWRGVYETAKGTRHAA